MLHDPPAEKVFPRTPSIGPIRPRGQITNIVAHSRTPAAPKGRMRMTEDPFPLPHCGSPQTDWPHPVKETIGFVPEGRLDVGRSRLQQHAGMVPLITAP